MKSILDNELVDFTRKKGIGRATAIAILDDILSDPENIKLLHRQMLAQFHENPVGFMNYYVKRYTPDKILTVATDNVGDSESYSDNICKALADMEDYYDGYQVDDSGNTKNGSPKNIQKYTKDIIDV